MPLLPDDVRFAARALRRSPGVTLVAVVALALGIGLTTTVFSIVYAALVRGLPYDGAERVAVVITSNPSRGAQRMPVTIHDYAAFREEQRSFESLAASYNGTVNVSGTERAERYMGTWMTAELFDVIGVRPSLGRGIRAGEDAPGGERVVVISHRMWQDRFGGDAGVLGTTLRANGQPYTIVGVMPAGFALPDNAQLWMPLQLDPVAIPRGTGQRLDVMGRLRPGVPLEAASAELGGIARRLQAAHPKSNEGVEARATTFVDGELGPEPRQLLYTMLGAVLFVLLIACANVANLLLDRAAHRTREVGIRTALGASRVAAVRQFLAEALVIAAVAAVLGVGIAYAGVDLFNRAIADTEPPSWLDIALHPPVLLFAIGMGLLAALASGIFPAVQASRTDINEVLKDDSRGASSFRIGRVSRALVVFEIALSCGLLVAAGLMIKSVVRMGSMDPGVRTERIFTARLGFPAAYTDTLAQQRFYERLEPRLAAIPGVRAVALASGLPAVGGGRSVFAVEGATYATDRDYPETRTLMVTPGFFETFELAPVQGRVLAAMDREDALPVAVVSRGFAARFFPDQDPIGRRVRLGGPGSEAPWLTIVGVVPDVYSGNPDEPRFPALYAPLAQNHAAFVSLALWTAGPPLALTGSVRDAVASVDPDIPIYWTRSMEEAIARPLWAFRVFGTMFMIFGAIALFLASVGLYAVIAFSVSRRTREVGIRMALGAQAGDVVRLIFRQGLAQLAIGVVLGLALAFGVSRLLAMILFDVRPTDPVVFGTVVAVLAAAGALACVLPARRAVRVDPLVALRAE